MRGRWEGDEKGDQVLCDNRGDGCKTVTVGSTEWPLRPWKVASLMNEAFRSGYRQAQSDIRDAMGVKS